MNFKIGQSVVHNKYGIGILVGIECREFTPGKPMSFYIMEVYDNPYAGAVKKKIFIPQDKVETTLSEINK